MKGMRNSEKQSFIMELSAELQLNPRQIRMWMKNRKKRGEYKGKNQYSLEVIEMLESYCRCRPYPTKEEKAILAKELNIPEPRIKKWFQTRRERGPPASVSDRVVTFAPPIQLLNLLAKYLECNSLSLLEYLLSEYDVHLAKDKFLSKATTTVPFLFFGMESKDLSGGQPCQENDAYRMNEDRSESSRLDDEFHCELLPNLQSLSKLTTWHVPNSFNLGSLLLERMTHHAPVSQEHDDHCLSSD